MKLSHSEPYSRVKFLWVSSHWDYHREGLCTYNGTVCAFKAYELFGMYDNDIMCHIYELDRFEKLWWLLHKRAFEWCVGYHWTYPQRNDGIEFSNDHPTRMKLYYMVQDMIRKIKFWIPHRNSK